LSTPGPEQSEPLRCRLEQDAVDEATHQIDNWVMILEPRLDMLLKCLSGEPSADSTESANNPWQEAKTNPKAFAAKAALHQVKTGIQVLKQQIGGAAINETRPTDGE